MTHNIISAIDALGCGHNALAEALDVRPDTVQKWVSGKAEVPAGVWLDIARMARQRADAVYELAVSIAAPEVADLFPATGPDRVSTAVIERLQWIVMQVRLAGRVNRGEIVERFGVSGNQATADIARLIERMPALMEYDPSAKAYILRPG